MAKGWLDNFGKEDNYNDSQASAPEGFQGDGYSNVGRNYSPAWRGQFQKGGTVFLQPTDSKLPWAYNNKTKDYNSEVAMSIGGENGEPAYLIPTFKKGKFLKDPIKEYKKTGEHLGGPFKNWQDADKWEQEVRHPAVEQHRSIIPYTYSNMQMGGNVYPVNYVPQAQMGGSLPGATGMMYARTGAPSKGPRRNQTDVTDASAQNGKEMQYYQEGLDFKPKTISRDGSVIKDDLGQWAHPGEITEIGSNNITMEGVPYDVLGISDTGDTKLMKPGKNYKFKGKKVTEYPMAKNGVNQQDEKSLQQLDQLTNFTNYNTKQPGGWLDTL